MDRKEFFADINDFYNSWEDFIWSVKKHKTKCNETYNEDLYVGLKVLELLMWHGIPIEKIPDIKLSDVSYKGIKGYNVTFDERTLDLFMEYKKMTGVYICRGIDENPTFQEFKQNTFFRTISRKSNDIVTKNTIVYFMNRSMEVENEDDELKKLFLSSYIYPNGSLCYVYDRLNGGVPKKETVCRLAAEFGMEFNAPTSEQTYFKKFKRYYAFRQKWDEEHTGQNEVEQSEQIEHTENVKFTSYETERASAEEVSDDIINAPILTEQLEEPKTEQGNTVDICLDILSGLRTSISLISNQIDTIENALRKMKQ